MDNSPLLTPNTPRLAASRTQIRSGSQSPTRRRFTDDLLSDLSPATTLEAFTNPSGKLKASVEAATPNERAFGIRATLASKKIQEWVDELSSWPWPAKGGSIGFEMPATKRRRLSNPFIDPYGSQSLYKETGMTNRDEPKYIGSLLAEEVDRYEIRIDEIQADMEDLNVEDIKRQVLDTHFSARSRPSSSASNVPMPQFLSSYVKMDDFTAIVTSTVLQSLPNLSKLMRLMDVWTVRLSVLRKVPPLLLALEDTEVALKSGWNAIGNPIHTTDTSKDGASEEFFLSRETFDVMRNVLRDKVTALGQDLDFLLDTLEGRQDTLPDSWLDRMEDIENDYGSWDAAGDRKVREGEWAKLAKERKEEEDARRLREAEQAEIARLKAEQEVRETAERMARQQEEDEAQRKAEEDARRLREAEEAELARQIAEQEAKEEAERKARQKSEDEARRKAEEDALRLREAEEAENARRVAEQEAKEAAERIARQKSEDEARRKAEEDALRLREAEEAENARQVAEQEVKEEAERIARQKKEDEAQRKADRDAQEAEAAELARLQAEQDAKDAAREAQMEAEALKEARQKAEHEAARLQAEKEAQDAATRKAEQEAQDLTRRKAREEAEAARVKDQYEADQPEAVRLKTMKDAEEAIRQAQLEAETAEAARLISERQAADDAKIQAEQESLTQIQTQRKADEAATAETAGCRASDDTRMEVARLQAQTDSEIARQEKETQESQVAVGAGVADDGATKQGPDCHICDELQDVDEAALRIATRVPMGSATSSEVSMRTSNFFDAVKPSISRYAPYDGVHEGSGLLVSTPDNAAVERGSDAREAGLDSPIHLNEGPPHLELQASATPTEPPTGPDESATPESQKTPPFGHESANAIPNASLSPGSSIVDQPQNLTSFQPERSLNAPDLVTAESSVARPRTPIRLLFPADGAEDVLQTRRAISMKSNEDSWVFVNSSDEEDVLPAEDLIDSTYSSPSKAHDPMSLSLGYSSTDPTPEIQEAEPAGYFRPVLSPVESARSPAGSELVSPSRSPLIMTPVISLDRALPALDGPASPRSPYASSPRTAKEVLGRRMSPIQLERGGDECDSCDSLVQDRETEESAYSPVPTRKTSITQINSAVRQTEESLSSPVLAQKPLQINSPVRRISIPLRESISSETPTIITRHAGEPPASPMGSPITDSIFESFPEDDQTSPSAGRIRIRERKSYDYSPPDSPQRVPRLSPQRSLHILKSPNLSPPDSTAPSTPVEAPVFENVDVTTAPVITSPKKVTTDEQIQQQISSLLETIPASIRLTSDPESPGFAAQNLRPKKTRRSITPHLRPSSSMSNFSTSTTHSRAPTPGPQFTLAPAYAKTGQRTRIHNGNPEIKLYHLSRSTGEAPIKLFVRLVGEHGERVMVRVGGGWADLGEYLKEYASHHGRRSAADAGDKIEIQDLPPRVVSNSSTTSTVRGSGRDTPIPRPFSVLERERPGSSLNVRKTRKSIGDHDPLPVPSRINDTRSPSTPLPITARRLYETPPSAASIASSTSGTGPSDRSSRLSWTEEDSSLGLAGPKSKKVVISERDQEWVESMKEKVRLASAEKEKREQIERDRNTSFGEMDKVGGTKRLFRKG